MGGRGCGVAAASAASAKGRGWREEGVWLSSLLKEGSSSSRNNLPLPLSFSVATMADPSPAPAPAPAATAAATGPAPSHGTVIKSMVERFRYGSPLSRAERAKLRETGSASDFWWKKEGAAGPSGSASASANVSVTEAGGAASQAAPAPSAAAPASSSGSASAAANAAAGPFDPNVSFASFMPDTQPPASYRYGGASSMPQTPATAGRPVMDA